MYFLTLTSKALIGTGDFPGVSFNGQLSFLRLYQVEVRVLMVIQVIRVIGIYSVYNCGGFCVIEIAGAQACNDYIACASIEFP